MLFLVRFVSGLIEGLRTSMAGGKPIVGPDWGQGELDEVRCIKPMSHIKINSHINYSSLKAVRCKDITKVRKICSNICLYMFI